MKRLVLALVFLSAFIDGVSAQIIGLDPPKGVTVTKGPILNSKTSVEAIIGKDAEGIYIQTRSSKLSTRMDVSLGRYNSKMELEIEKQLSPLLIDGEKCYLEKLFFSDNILVMFASFYDQKLRTKTLYGLLIDKTTHEASGEPLKIAENIPFNRKIPESYYSTFILSRDRSKILLHRHKGGDSDGVTISLNVLQKGLNKMWSADVTVPYSADLFRLEELVLDNNGDVYIMGKVFKERNEREKGAPNYTYVIVEFNENGTKRNEYTIDLGDKYVRNLIPGLNASGQLVCGGFYSTSNKVGVGAAGSFFVSIDRNTRQIVHQSFKPFSAAFIAQDQKAGAAKKVENKAEDENDIGIINLSLKQVIQKDDGGLIAIGEQKWERSVPKMIASGAPGGTKSVTETTYYCNDIVVVSINAEGNIEWNAKVPKRQKSVYTGLIEVKPLFFSYGSLYDGSSVYLVFNENPRNMSYDGDGKIETYTSGDALVVMVEIDEQGQVFKNSLLTKDFGSNLVARPELSIQVDKNNMVLYMERVKEKSFVLIGVDE